MTIRVLACWIFVLTVCPGARADDDSLPPPRVIKHARQDRAVRAARTPPLTPRPTPLPAQAERVAGAVAPMPQAPESPPVSLAPGSPLAIQREIDAYFRDDPPLLAPTSMPGVAGYDQGFRFRTGGFRLALNFVLQTRYEAFLHQDTPPQPAQDLSGFSIPRALVRLSGTAEPNFQYFLELDFGHHGAAQARRLAPPRRMDNLGPTMQADNFDVLREAWIEWNPTRVINIRGGLYRTPASRQLLVRPESQQFVDIALASAWTGAGMPGYTDRNRDYGVMVHGRLGDNDQMQYMLSVSNGDGGDHVRNVLDSRSSDNLAYAGRFNYVFLRHIGHQEGALQQCRDRWYGELGAWGYYYGDRSDAPREDIGDVSRYGVDLALGYGSWSFTGGLVWGEERDLAGGGNADSTAWLLQFGHHLAGTAWEFAARWSGYDASTSPLGGGNVHEYALAVNYYLNGHGTKLQFDASYIDVGSSGQLILEPYGGYPGGVASGASAWLFRFQWQLAL